MRAFWQLSTPHLKFYPWVGAVAVSVAVVVAVMDSGAPQVVVAVVVVAIVAVAAVGCATCPSHHRLHQSYRTAELGQQVSKTNWAGGD